MKPEQKIGGRAHRRIRGGILNNSSLIDRMGIGTSTVSDDEDYAAMYTMDDTPNLVQIAVGTIEGIRFGRARHRKYVPRASFAMKESDDRQVCLKTRWLQVPTERTQGLYSGRVRMPHQPTNPICDWCPFGEYLTRVIMDEDEAASGEGQVYQIRQECMDDIIDEVYKYLEKPGNSKLKWKDAWCSKNHWRTVVKVRLRAKETANSPVD